VSVHGGNRLGANSLLDTLISGAAPANTRLRAPRHRDAGRRPRGAAARGRRPPRRDHRPPARGPAGVGDQERARRGDEPTRRGVSRRGRAAGALEAIGRLREEPIARGSTIAARSSTRTCSARSSSATWSTARGTLVGAIERKESRGAQFRTDFPERNDEDWLKHIDITLEDGSPKVSYSPVTITQWQPRRGNTDG